MISVEYAMRRPLWHQLVAVHLDGRGKALDKKNNRMVELVVKHMPPAGRPDREERIASLFSVTNAMCLVGFFR